MQTEKWEARQAARKRRHDLRDRAIAYKGGRCAICGYTACAAAFDFHHVDDLTKEFSISDRMTSWVRIKAELDKCELLCARCHREVHDGLHPTFLALHEDKGGYDEPFEDDEEECEF